MCLQLCFGAKNVVPKARVPPCHLGAASRTSTLVAHRSSHATAFVQHDAAASPPTCSSPPSGAMAAVTDDGAMPISDAATLSSRQKQILSQILEDIRTNVQHLSLPDVNPLSATDATAVDALKDLYYMLNVEDPLNALPARQYVFASRTVQTLLHPIINALHSHSSATQNQKRWSVPTYQALRTLCVLTTPIPDTNQFLPRGCALDSHRAELRSFLAHHPAVLDAMVTLLQYYLERKAAKLDDLASAESCRLEDARIDNILTFFRNILSPPRAKPGDPSLVTDVGIHLALVAALHKVDFYATLSVLYASPSPEEMRLHTTATVFLTADIYAFTLRHSTPKSMFHTLRTHPYLRQSQSQAAQHQDTQSSTGNISLPPTRIISKTRSSNLRAALLKERATIGGSRAVTAPARWTNHHSGGFSLRKMSDPNARATDVTVPLRMNTKRIISSKAFVQSKLSFNPKRPFQEAVSVNSEVLCLSAAKKRSAKDSGIAGKAVPLVRKDLQDAGLQCVVKLAAEFIDVSFSNFVRVVRDRIVETKERTKRENPEALTRAQRSFLSVVGSVVGFQRERYGKVRKDNFEEPRPLNADIHQNHMKAVLSSDFKILKKDWKTVEAAIELGTFQLAFRVLVESFEALKGIGKDEINIESIEVATFAVLEMMKMLQGMSAHVKLEGNQIVEQTADANPLTPRELALNTLEDLFREEVFLNAPANLAKDFNSKLFSFRHLTNIVELGYSFTSILMDEEELHRLQVNKKKRPRKKKVSVGEKTGEKEVDEEHVQKEIDEERAGEKGDEEERLQNEDDGEKTASKNPEKVGIQIPESILKARKVKRIIDTSDDDEEVPQVPTSSISPEEDQENISQPAPENVDGDTRDIAKMVDQPEVRPVSDKDMTDNTAASSINRTLNHNNETTEASRCNEDARTGDRSKMEAPPLSIPDEIEKVGREESRTFKADGDREDKPAEIAVKENQPKNRDAEDGGHTNELHQMLEIDADEETTSLGRTTQEKAGNSSRVREALLADAEAEAKAKAKENTEKARRMLMADAENEERKLQAKFVTTRNQAISEGIALGSKEGMYDKSGEGDGDDESGDSEVELEIREMESMGIIRRFAHIRAIQTFMLPIRAMICHSVALTGQSFPIPEGAKALLSPILVAKSTHLISSIWKVAKLRERGSLCGQFFTLGNMHFMELLLNAPLHSTVMPSSVLDRLGVLARDVTKTFFEWLSVNPGLTLDMVFGMDKGSCQMYTSYIRQKAASDKRKEDEKDSGNDSDISQLSILQATRRDDLDGGKKTRRERRSGTNRKSAARRRQLAERPKLEEDEDVDDLDNLNIGIMESDDDEAYDDNQKFQSTTNNTNDESRSDPLGDSHIENGTVGRQSELRARKSFESKRKKRSRRKRRTVRPELDEEQDVDDIDKLELTNMTE
eukprot:TRINITY_DN1749_c0_g1_i4.p1 TRINITY_DN1749_c0_g1~~TRINITY_DN1749_c0_g1_i4.p1  ORF type:complete len:1421 (-),score=296.05 TRINITY_DN1749_c0_g1_i4:5124-9386(-)